MFEISDTAVSQLKPVVEPTPFAERLVSPNFIHPSEHASLRSPLWNKVQKAHLKLQPICQGCGLAFKLNVHHIKPFHLFPELELVQSNFITLCEDGVHDCHYHIGHLLDWHAYNPDVAKDAAIYLAKVKNRPVA